MSFSFNPTAGLIIVPVLLLGPAGNATLNLALDTGASRTLINEDMLIAVGYDPAQAGVQSKITTGSQIEAVSLIRVDKIRALGEEHIGLLVICHTLPPSASVDGLLGLDFFRGLNLNLGFRRGLITLTYSGSQLSATALSPQRRRDRAESTQRNSEGYFLSLFSFLLCATSAPLR